MEDINSELTKVEEKRISIDLPLSIYKQLHKIAWLEARSTKAQAQLLLTEKVKDLSKAYLITINENK